MVTCLCFEIGRKTKLKDNSDKKSKRDKSPSSTPSPARPERVSETVLDVENRCRIFSHQELATATNNFSDESLIGRGGFGTVYKGRLDTGEEIAVKMHDNNGGGQGDKEYLVEVLMLSIHHHDNLKIISTVKKKKTTPETRKSIGKRFIKVFKTCSCLCVLSDLKDDQEPLDWNTRMKIAAGAAKGLEYLHRKANPSVIYRDLKPSNILLDHEYKPKLSDFGLAKFGPSEGRSHVSTRVMGTHGYCAPEYASTGKLTQKSDIYSFGVVLLELISGRKALMPSCDCVDSQSRYLVHWAQTLFSGGHIEQIVDPKLSRKGGFSKKALKRTLQVAMMCLFEDPNARPLITEVVSTLDYIVEYQSMRRTTRRGQRGDTERAGTSSSQDEMTRMLNVLAGKSDPLERRRVVDDAKSWADDWRKKGSQSTAASPSQC
ncbi:PREDICTED: serine/threonine-protein kinase CDG1-like [Camelina sativa]|uniref:Serine/threonine-protein kinase CDG1-like n=1 Tax=Camelina sativa TaxID=90675 RepID=A0ABM1RS32_CAMSA|nr:PREDICTED: serine/threonine-protein kinase CDG1-like [Camelina sativa]